MKKVLVVFNPVSGKKGWKDIPRIIKSEVEKNKCSLDWFETVKAEKQPLEPFLGKKYHRIIVAGGDGTVASVIDFMLRNNWLAPLVIIPQGSANLLATTLELPVLQIRKAVKTGLTKEPQKIDLMGVNKKHYAIIGVGRGYDTFLMKETKRELKRRWGVLAYLWTFLKTFLKFKKSKFRITVDGKHFTVRSKMVVILNIFPLGHLKAAAAVLGGQIIPNDGKLNMFILKGHHRFDHISGKEFVIKTKNEHKFEMDGDVFKSRTINIKVLPKAISIVHNKKFK